ncbi:MAG TPA: hypothetical protein VGK82_13915 [Pyrinomonadaceae bacterium]
MKPTRPQLVNLLIGKSILETIFVATLAVIVWTNAFPPTFHGWGEALNSQAIAGWAVNNASPWERVEVQLFIDEKLYASQVARLSRPDIVKAGWAKDEWHGYNFTIAGLVPGRHEARIYALHQSGERMTLQLLGDPIPFAVDHR